jgi:hypothetical protein
MDIVQMLLHARPHSDFAGDELVDVLVNAANFGDTALVRKVVALGADVNGMHSGVSIDSPSHPRVGGLLVCLFACLLV